MKHLVLATALGLAACGGAGGPTGEFTLTRPEFVAPEWACVAEEVDMWQVEETGSLVAGVCIDRHPTCDLGGLWREPECRALLRCQEAVVEFAIASCE